jgi:hypothetical protein
MIISCFPLTEPSLPSFDELASVLNKVIREVSFVRIFGLRRQHRLLWRFTPGKDLTLSLFLIANLNQIIIAVSADLRESARRSPILILFISPSNIRLPRYKASTTAS